MTSPVDITPFMELAEVSRVYGSGDTEVRALDSVSLSIWPGDFVSIVGPSGSGKSTLLGLLGCLDAPSSGRIVVDGEDVTDVPPFDRNVNTVFQDYALFPHMSVAENVAYGPRVRRVGAAERRRRAIDMLELVQLGEFADRRPNQLRPGAREPRA